MSGSRKKVILRKFSRDWTAGYLSPEGFVEAGTVQLLEQDGKVASLPLEGVKWICFVREFQSGEAGNPERLLRKQFTGRPRGEGVWLRLRLKDGDLLEGLAANDASLLNPDGILLTPPDTRSNTQRIFIPHGAIAEAQALAVISQRKPRQEKIAQPELFDPEG